VDISATLDNIRHSLFHLLPEILLVVAIVFFLSLSLVKRVNEAFVLTIAVMFSVATIGAIVMETNELVPLFGNLVSKEGFSNTLKILFNISAVLTFLMSFHKEALLKHLCEYCALIFAVVLGSHFLLMSNHFLMVFISLELISISSYILAAYASDRAGSEGSLKYFLFGSVASAIMLYGFSILYGLTGSLDFTSEQFTSALINDPSPFVTISGLMVLAGFLFKISAAPMHPWTPDVYEGAQLPIIAFFSVAPKLAGVGILAKYVLAINLYGQSKIDWQMVLAVVAMITLAVGNFSALAQKNVKRMMAYSSIAQSGFLMIGLIAFLPQGLHFMVFYAFAYTFANFLVFIFLGVFESRFSLEMRNFSGAGKLNLWASLFILTGFIALTGLPPTAGFTGKLFIFSSLWESYQLSGNVLLLWLLIFGLINTVISLFYYLKIPYLSFLKQSEHSLAQPNNVLPLNFFNRFQNLLGLILVVLVLALFFVPGLLMGWINKVNFVF
jgi:NADH-quinone oxidoreductase subunit N